jgi:hypothetical protein
MMRKSFLAIAVTAALVVGVYAASSAPKPVTAGEFAVKVSRAMGVERADSKAAAAALKSFGVNFGTDLNASLTEGQAARILGDLGLRVSTTTPSSVVFEGKADSLASLARAATVQAGIAPAGLPTQCLNSPDRGTCVDCCKAAVGSITDAGGNPKDPGPLCSKFCQSLLPPGKQSSPEPSP